MIPVELKLSDAKRAFMPGRPVEFGKLAILQGEHMGKYLAMMATAMSDAAAAGLMPTPISAESWEQDDGSLLVVMPGVADNHYSMQIPAGQWSMASVVLDDEQSQKLAREMAEKLSGSPFGDALREAFNDAERTSRNLAGMRRNYEQEYQSGLIVFDKSPESLLALADFEFQVPALGRLLGQWRSDTRVQYLVVHSSPTGCRTFACIDLQDALGRGLQRIADEFGPDISRIGVGTPSRQDPARAIADQWHQMGGGRPF